MTELTDLTLQELININSVDDRRKWNFIETLFPDYGPYRRELYQKHMEFFSQGKPFDIRLFMAGNQIGKTSSGGCFEVACHVMGQYPNWWDEIGGMRYEYANDWWVAGETLKDVRNILQRNFLGKNESLGSGLLRRDTILFEAMTKPTKTDTFINQIPVRHALGGTSLITLKSYDQGREVFQGEAVNVMLDEQPPDEILNECVTRQTTTRADRPLKMILTYSPLKGMSGAMKSIFPRNKVEFGDLGNGIYVVNASMMDVPHITEEKRNKLLAFYPEHQRQARMLGLPTVTEGAIYGIDEKRFVIPACLIPDYWPRIGGLDVGWNRTAALWLAHDRENGIWHIYREYYGSKMLPSEHADHIRAKGDWIPLNIDPASRGRSQRDGEQLIQNYKDLGLNLDLANNAVEAGIEQVLTLLASDRLKVHNTCTNWLDEYRRYSRDKDGKVIKIDDHLMDATRYSITTHSERSTGRDRALTEMEWKARRAPIVVEHSDFDIPMGEDSWMAS
ncbi:MAG: terminase large subunit domain-containing protein [Steroidobacteraceae bacterium]